MIKRVCSFLSSSRLIVCCCLIILIFAQSTADASDDIYYNSKELSSNKEKNIDYKMKIKAMNFGDYKIETNVTDSKVAVIAIHGGKIEQGTTELAYAVSSRNNYSYYSYIGLKSRGNSTLHIDSDKFKEPTALEMLAKSQTTLSIHGCAGSAEFTYIGGLDTELRNKIKKSLMKRGFTVLDAPRNLAGLSPDNIANRNRNGSGVQLEISKGLRTQFLAADNARLNSYVLALSEAVNSIQ